MDLFATVCPLKPLPVIMPFMETVMKNYYRLHMAYNTLMSAYALVKLRTIAIAMKLKSTLKVAHSLYHR